jgi:hypothetical protein
VRAAARDLDSCLLTVNDELFSREGWQRAGAVIATPRLQLNALSP